MAAQRPPSPPHTMDGALPLGPASPIPDKRYFKIGEVAQLVGVQPHVLRYWEKEVPSVRPGKSVSNQRRYRRRDVETFREIRRLLYEERYTLAGAKKRIQNGPGAANVDGETSELETATAVPTSAAPVAVPDPPIVAAANSQMPLEFPSLAVQDKLERVKVGLRELIRMAGEEP